mgnify:CR=1 FL=1
MNIILIAPQAAGKGTQAALIRDKYHIPHISMGDLLRAVRNEDTDLARTVIKCQDSGILVPQEIVSEVLAERLKKEDCLNGYILDGYPRNMEQAKLLAESGSKIDYVIYLNVKKDEVLKRITGRRMCKECGANYNINYADQSPKVSGVCDKCNGELIQRSDDTEESIKKRLDIYYKDTEPLIDLYKNENILYEVNGEKSPLEVFEDIKNILGE